MGNLIRWDTWVNGLWTWSDQGKHGKSWRCAHAVVNCRCLSFTCSSYKVIAQEYLSLRFSKLFGILNLRVCSLKDQLQLRFRCNSRPILFSQFICESTLCVSTFFLFRVNVTSENSPEKGCRKRWAWWLNNRWPRPCYGCRVTWFSL